MPTFLHPFNRLLEALQQFGAIICGRLNPFFFEVTKLSVVTLQEVGALNGCDGVECMRGVEGI